MVATLLGNQGNCQSNLFKAAENTDSLRNMAKASVFHLIKVNLISLIFLKLKTKLYDFQYRHTGKITKVKKRKQTKAIIGEFLCNLNLEVWRKMNNVKQKRVF